MYFESVEFLIRIFIVAAVVGLVCFFCGCAYSHRKHKWRREELRRLQNWKESTKGLCSKLQDGRDPGFKRGASPLFRKNKPGPYYEAVPFYEITNHGDPKDS